MRFWPRRTIETKSSTLANPDPELLALFGAGTPSVITRQQAMAIPAVNGAIKTISEAAATLAIKVVQIEDDGTETDQPGHPVARLLCDEVNDWTSGFEFVRDLVAQAMTNDAGGLAWVNRVEGKPAEIIQYRPSMIAVTLNDATGEPSYTVNSRPMPAGDIVHLRSPFSQCPLTLAMRAVSVAYHLESHALNLFKNGARPATVIRFKKGLGDEALKKMKAGWNAAFGGPENGGRTAILWDDAEIDTLALNSTDAQFLENRKFAIIEIARAFRVPPGMLFELDRVTWSNGEQQGREFLVYCLEPWLRALESCLRRALFRPDERAQYRIVFDRDDLTRASLTERATAINSLVASETINPNTGRDWLGLPPYDGGDEYGNRNITVEPTKPAAQRPKAVAA